MSEGKERNRCKATTKSGTQCKNFAQPDQLYCYTHRDMAKKTKTSPGSKDTATIQDLLGELDDLVAELKAFAPEKSGTIPASMNPDKLVNFIKSNLDKVTPEVARDIAASFQGASKEDLFDPDTWKGMWYMLNYSMKFQAEQLKQKLLGDETEE